MFNDEFEELGSKNDKKITIKIELPEEKSKICLSHNDQ
jgi:hypothetical protein